MLASEYQEKALRNTIYMGHIFDEERMQWMPEAEEEEEVVEEEEGEGSWW